MKAAVHTNANDWKYRLFFFGVCVCVYIIAEFRTWICTFHVNKSVVISVQMHGINMVHLLTMIILANSVKS